MHPVEEYLAVFHPGVAVLEIDPAQADGLNFRSLQHDAGLHGFFDEIVVAGLAVFCNYLDLGHSLILLRLLYQSCCGEERTGRRRKERSEEHTSELQSRENLVCRLL